MPELPDVESYRRYIHPAVVNKRIAAVHIYDSRFLANLSKTGIQRFVADKSVQDTWRKGKNLYLKIENSGWLLLHFGMTGYPLFSKTNAEDPPHTRFRLDFEKDGHLSISCQRLLGKAEAVTNLTAHLEENKVGPDALSDVDFSYFDAFLSKKRGKIKSALMDQEKIAGIGNVYSDEILFQARVHPETRPADLNHSEKQKLFSAMKSVLSTAVENNPHSGGFLKRLPDTYILPRRGGNAPCPKCGTPLVKKKISGRSSIFCAACQTKKEAP